VPIVVPQFPPVLDTSEGDALLNADLRAAHPVRGTFQWEDFGRAAAWALGRGGTLVMQGPSGLGVAAGADETWRWWTRPRAQTVARLWCVSLGMRTAPVANHHATGAFTAGLTPQPFTISPSQTGRVAVYRVLERLPTPSATPAEVTLEIDVDSGAGGAVYLEGATCYEISRATLTEYGAGPSPVPDVGTLQTGALITEASTTAKSVDGLFNAVLDASLMQTETRRGCLFSDYRPAGMIVGTSYTNLYLRNPAVLARARYAGETVRSVELAFYGHGPAGSNVRITATSGDVATLPLPTSDGWTSGYQMDINTEDPARWGTDGGIRGGTRDRLTIEGQRVGGSAGDAVVYGIYVGEGD
jgi:hypothetical protein